MLPVTAAPVLMVMLVAASTFPWNMEPTSMVAEVSTCQKTWLALAPPARMTCEPTPVVRVDPILKMKTALGSPWASRVTLLFGPAPEIKTDVEFTYRPGVKVNPPILPGKTCALVDRLVASLKAASRSACACVTMGSLTWMVPLTCAGGMPCEVPGAKPTLPLMTTGPVLVIEAVAITAKLPAEPRLIVAGPAAPAAAPVVKLQGSGGFDAGPLAKALPDRSLTMFEIVAVYWVIAVRVADGVKVAIWLAES